MSKTFVYNASNQNGLQYLTLNDLPNATILVNGIVKLSPYVYKDPEQTPVNIVYDAAAIDEMIESATSGGITSVVKTAGSSAFFTVTKSGATVTLGVDDATNLKGGLVTLSDATDSTLNAATGKTAASPAAVKSAYDLAATKISSVTLTADTGTSASGTTISILGSSAIDTVVSNTPNPTVTVSLDIAGAKLALGLGSAAYANTGTLAGQIPVLDANGKLSGTILPSIALVDTFVCPTAANDAAITTFINSLTGDPKPEQGDIIIVRAGAKVGTYIIITTKAVGSYTDADWTNLEVPTGGVTSIVFAGTTYNPVNGIITIANVPWSSLTSVPSASTTVAGIVQLNNTTNSTSTTLAATANSVKLAYDLANSKVSATLATTAAAVTSIKIGDSSLTYANKTNTDVAVVGYIDNKATDISNTLNANINTAIDTAFKTFEFTKAQLVTGSGTVTVLNFETKQTVTGVYLVNGANNDKIYIGCSVSISGTTLSVTIFDTGADINTIYDGFLANANSKLVIATNLSPVA